MLNVQMNKFGNNASSNFFMTFANGYTVSVAMGDGTYSNGNQDRDGYSSVEVGAWDDLGNWVQLGTNDSVVGWQSAEEVLAIMNKIAAM